VALFARNVSAQDAKLVVVSHPEEDFADDGAVG